MKREEKLRRNYKKKETKRELQSSKTRERIRNPNRLEPRNSKMHKKD